MVKQIPAWRRPHIATVMWCALVVLFAAAAVDAHTRSAEVQRYSGTISCGSLASPATGLSELDRANCDWELGGHSAMRLVAITLAGATAGGLALAWVVRRRTHRSIHPIPGPNQPLLPDALVSDLTTVRPVRTTDAAAVAATIDDTVVRTMGWREHDARSWPPAIAAGRAVGLHVIVAGTDDTPIGVVTVDRVAALMPGVDVRLGLWMGAASRGQGHMRRAVDLIVERLTSNGDGVFAETAFDNLATRAILERSGFAVFDERVVVLPNGIAAHGVSYFRAAQTAPVPSPEGRPAASASG